MKRCVPKKWDIILTLSVLIFTSNVLRAQTRVFSETFDSGTFPPTGWSIVNGNPSPTSYNWVKNTSTTYNYNASAGSLMYTYSTVDSAYTFAMLPGILMTAGYNYYVVFYTRVRSGTYPENLAVTVGQGQTVAAQTTLVNAYPGITTAAYTRVQTSNYTPSSSGTYNFAFLCYSAADMWNLYVDSVNVYENIPPSDDAAIAAVSPQGLNYISASATTGIAMQNSVINKGSSIASFTVTRTIPQLAYSSTVSVSNLAPGATQLVTFTPLTGFTGGVNYSFKDSIYFSGDVNPSNDTMSANFTLNIAKPILIYYQDKASADSIATQLTNAGYANMFDSLQLGSMSAIDIWHTSIFLFSPYYSWSIGLRNQMQSYLDNATTLNKRSLFIFGNDIGFVSGNPSSSTTADLNFYSNYLHSNYLGDDWFTDFTSAQYKFNSFGPFVTNTCDSVKGDYPDYIKPVNGGLSAFKPSCFTPNADTSNAVYFAGSTYNIFYGTNVYSNYAKASGTIIQTIANWTINNGGTMPVRIESFQVTPRGTANLIDWSTAFEINNKGFYVEVSIDGIHFQDIGYVAAKGNGMQKGAYSFWHADAVKWATNRNTTTLYYRLRQVDQDAKTSFSTIVRIGIRTISSNRVALFPNPFQNSINLEFMATKNQSQKLEVLDLQGRLVVSQEMNYTEGLNKLNVDMSSLNAGIYIIKTEIDGEVFYQEISK